MTVFLSCLVLYYLDSSEEYCSSILKKYCSIVICLMFVSKVDLYYGFWGESTEVKCHFIRSYHEYLVSKWFMSRYWPWLPGWGFSTVNLSFPVLSMLSSLEGSPCVLSHLTDGELCALSSKVECLSSGINYPELFGTRDLSILPYLFIYIAIYLRQ